MKDKQNNYPITLENQPFFGLDLDDEQKIFRDAIWNEKKKIIFCNAKAGTGKTTIAVGVGHLLVKYGRYKGISYIVSPTQEQLHGFLPGDVEDKSAPYMEPLYDALLALNINPNTAIISSDNIQAVKNGEAYIKCMAHTYLRGTNFDNEVIVLDESQNFYGDQLKKVLTRIHDNCKVIVIGHSGQVDLYKNPERSGFLKYLEWFKGDDRTAICELTINYRGWISSHADDLDI